MVCYGLYITARHQLIGALVFVSGLRNSFLFLAAEVCTSAGLPFDSAILVPRLRIRFVLTHVFISSTLLLVTMLYQCMRHNQSFTHLREDPCMLMWWWHARIFWHCMWSLLSSLCASQGGGDSVSVHLDAPVRWSMDTRSLVICDIWSKLFCWTTYGLSARMQY